MEIKLNWTANETEILTNWNNAASKEKFVRYLIDSITNELTIEQFSIDGLEITKEKKDSFDAAKEEAEKHFKEWEIENAKKKKIPKRRGRPRRDQFRF